MKSSTNSKMGSRHWYNTLVGRIRRTGEFLSKHDPPNNEYIREWGRQMEEDAIELINGFNQINKPSMQEKIIKHIPVMVLGVISIAEILATRSLGGSFFLWIGYGVYKMLK